MKPEDLVEMIQHLRTDIQNHVSSVQEINGRLARIEDRLQKIEDQLSPPTGTADGEQQDPVGSIEKRLRRIDNNLLLLGRGTGLKMQEPDEQ